jgi:hypothetical protein
MDKTMKYRSYEKKAYYLGKQNENFSIEKDSLDQRYYYLKNKLDMLKIKGTIILKKNRNHGIKRKRKNYTSIYIYLKMLEKTMRTIMIPLIFVNISLIKNLFY